MALVKDAYGKERVPGSSNEKNTSGGSTPAPSGSSVNEQQRAEQTAMRNLQKPSSSSSGSSSQTASGNPFASAQSSVPATSNAWKRTSTSNSNINQEQRSEQFSARRMGTTLQARQGGSGSYLGSQLQQQKQAPDTTPGWRAKSNDEANTTTPKQPQFQPFLSDRIKTRREMEGKGPDMVQDRLSDEQKALMDLVARLPEDFPADTWDTMPTYKQRQTIGKTDLNDQEQWMILNAGPSIKTLSMLLDLSQNQQEYGLSNAELLHVTDQLLEFGNLRTGAQNHEIFNGRVGLNKALHTFMSDKEDALYEDILLSASDRRAGNAQVEDDPDTGYNTGGSNNNSSIRYSPAENFRKLLAEKGYVIDEGTIYKELEKAGIDTSSLNEKQKTIAKETTELLIEKLKYNLLDDPEYDRTVREACRQIEAIDAGINAWGKKYWDTERQGEKVYTGKSRLAYKTVPLYFTANADGTINVKINSIEQGNFVFSRADITVYRLDGTKVNTLRDRQIGAEEGEKIPDLVPNASYYFKITPKYKQSTGQMEHLIKYNITFG